MVSVIDGEIIAMGGTTRNDVPLDSVIVYNPSTNSWSDQTPLPDGGRLAAVGGIIGNEIIVAAGFGNGQLNAQTWAAFAS